MMGRVTLVRSVLSSMPIYLLSNVILPKTIVLRIEQILRGFLWGSRPDGGGGVHLVAWEVVCQSRLEGGLGIQSLVTRREALIARHAARFLLRPDLMWSTMMRARYGNWPVVGEIRTSRRSSVMWKEICTRAPEVIPQTRWMIGDGRSVSVLYDTWIVDIPLSRWPTYVSSEVPDQMRVSDLLLTDGTGWDPTIVMHLFGTQLGRSVLSTALPCYRCSDIRVWRSSTVARPIAADLYHLYQPESNRKMDGGWIWKLGVHPRVSLFIWKIVWGRLPTRQMLRERGMDIQSTCPSCGTEEETMVHTLFLCPIARQAWFLGGPYHQIVQAEDPTRIFIDLLRRRATEDASREIAIRAAYIALQIWLARNSVVFESRRCPARIIVERALILAQEMLDATSRPLETWDSPLAHVATRRVFIVWEPPPPGYLKVNFDGSVRNRKGGAGFVIRGPDSRLVAAGGHYLSDPTVPGAELRAAWAGVAYARSVLGADHIVIEGDSTVVVAWIQRCKGGMVDHPLLRDISIFLSGCIGLTIRHIFREANSAADWVAAYVAEHTADFLWASVENIPRQLGDLLFSDRFGCIHTRFV